MEAVTTRVPALLDALYARLSDALEADGWQCFDGPPLAQVVEDDVFILGHPDFDGSAVTVDSEDMPGLSRQRQAEVINVRCIFSSAYGDERLGAKPGRDRCKAGVDIVEAALYEDHGLGGVVDRVGMGSTEQWGQFQTEDGAAVELTFTIEARVLR